MNWFASTAHPIAPASAPASRSVATRSVASRSVAARSVIALTVMVRPPWRTPALPLAGTWLTLLVGGLVSLLLLPAVPAAAADGDLQAKLEVWGQRYEQDVLPIVQKFCLDCHQGADADGEFDFGRFPDAATAIAAGDAWERVARRVRLNEMPPEGSPGLNDQQKAKFYAWVDSRPTEDLCKQIASDETQAWYRGDVMSRRLTAVEYTNAVQHLVGVPLLASEIPPSDGGGGEGFDTVGDALFTSPIHVEAYLATASRVIDVALQREFDSAATADSAVPRDSAVTADSAAELPRLLVALPQSLDPASALDEAQAAEQVIAAFARRAWRRPVSPDEVARLMTLYDFASRDGRADFTTAIGHPLKAILVSPYFLFVVESSQQANGVQRLTSYELATRLALLIWSSIPDESLLQLASSDAIFDEEVLRTEVRRMIADPKSRALGENFGLQWLGLRNFTELKPDAALFPEYTAALAEAMREEAIRTVAGAFQNDAPIRDLVAADYAYLNGTLAAHYDVPLPADADWQRVALDSGRRGGVITMASVLTVSSYPGRTSPVLRGRWVLDEMLGDRVPPPPPGVPALEEAGHDSEQVLTMRERLGIHRQNPECASCHNRMDPLGFGLENFDPIGRWRTIDEQQPIDATGTMPSGDSFDGPEEMKQVLLKRADELEKHFVRKLLGFAFGRRLNKFDMCVLDSCLETLRENDGRVAILLEEIAVSYPFQHRYFK